MSVSVTTVNGLIVVTQVFQPGEELKIPMNSIATPAAPATPAPTHSTESVEPSSPVSPMTKRFLQGQPKPLGIAQILLGLVTVALGIIFMWQTPVMWSTAISTGAVFFLSGTLSVIAHRGTRPCLIRSTLALNILSCLAAVTGIVIWTYLLITVRHYSSGCLESRDSRYYDNDNYYWMCQELYWKYRNSLDGLRGLLLTMSVLELAIALSGAIFAGKSSCSSSARSPAVVVIEKPQYGSDEALLGSEDAPGHPPPYDG